MSNTSDGFPGGNRRSYISTETFTSRFRSYRTYLDKFERKGELLQVTEDDSLCPKGRILRENGRKLHPGANPGVGKYLVGVYDPVSFLSGFIDPNEHVFAIFNTDKPYFIDNDNDSEHGSVNDDQSEGEGDDLGNPVYTRGNIETVGGDILANPIDTTRHNEGDQHYISLQNDVSGGNAAYFGFNDELEPYVEVYSLGDNGGQARISAYPLRSDLSMTSPSNILDLSVKENVSLTIKDTSGTIKLDLLVTESASLIIKDTSGIINFNLDNIGNIYNHGLLNPYTTCGTVLLNGSGSSTTTGYILDFSSNPRLPDNARDWIPKYLKVLVSYGNQGSLTNPGQLYSQINTDGLNGPLTNITIYSTNDNDNAYVNYMIISNELPLPLSPAILSIGPTNSKISYSTNKGLSWISAEDLENFSSCNSFAFNGSRWVAVGNCIVYSKNGRNWFNAKMPTDDPPTNITSIGYNGSTWVAGGSGKIIYSTDNGVTWNNASGARPNSIKSIACNGSRWIATGDFGSYTVYSNDGIFWYTVIDVPRRCNTVAYDGTNWVIGSSEEYMYYSSDGITFNYALGDRLQYCYSIAYNGSTWIAGGYQDSGNSRIVYSTNNGVNWTYATYANGSSLTNPIFSVAYNGSRWVAVGLNSTVIYSIDNGVTWNDASGSFLQKMYSVAYNGSTWVAGGYSNPDNYNYYSTDNGVSWSRASGNANRFLAVNNITNSTLGYIFN